LRSIFRTEGRCRPEHRSMCYVCLISRSWSWWTRRRRAPDPPGYADANPKRAPCSVHGADDDPRSRCLSSTLIVWSVSDQDRHRLEGGRSLRRCTSYVLHILQSHHTIPSSTTLTPDWGVLLAMPTRELLSHTIYFFALLLNVKCLTLLQASTHVHYWGHSTRMDALLASCVVDVVSSAGMEAVALGGSRAHSHP
jgi:hypothetical protein